MKKEVNILFLSLILSLFAACTANNEVMEKTENEARDAVQIEMDVDMPALQTSRSIDEDAIGDYVLFAFQDDKCISVRKKGDKNITISATNGKMYVLLPETSDAVDLLMLANVDLQKVKTMEEYNAISATKESILADFDFKCSEQTAAIPMCGQATLAEGVALGTKGSITLLRSMAKISVNVVDNSFTPISIKVVNVNDDATVYSASTEGVNIPANPETKDFEQSFNSGASASVYVGETMNIKEQGKRISVLLYGTYQGHDSWYRFDMITKDAKELDYIQRNHHYIFQVGGINYRGAQSAEAALANTKADNEVVGSDVNLFIIDNDAILSITSDDASYVGVSEQVVKMVGDSPVSVSVLTNNPNGWQIDDSECPGVFSILLGTGDKPVADEVQTLWIWREKATAGKDYVFYIVAGNIRKAITVKVVES